VIDQFTIWSGSVTPPPANAPPIVIASGDSGGDEGTPINVAATFTDSDVGDTHSATIDWGDASALEPGTVTESAGAGTAGGSHVYVDNGVYTVEVTVDDGRGGSVSDSHDVTVSNVAPTGDGGGPYAGTSGVGILFSGSATDPGADTFTYEWDFDFDGSLFDVDGSGAGPTHSYPLSGSYTVALRVRDDDGGTDLATASVSVVDAPDITPPTVPQGVVADVLGASEIRLSWDASSDAESGVSGYRVYRDGVLVDSPTGTTYQDIGLDPSTAYSYEVSSVNGAGIESPRSDPAGATTSPGPAFDYSWDFEDGTSEGWTNGGGGKPSGFALASPGLNGSTLRMAATRSSRNGNTDNTYLRFVTANDAVPTSGKLNVHATIKSHGQTNARGTAFGVTDGSGPRLVNRYGYIRFQNNGQIQYKVGSVWTDVTAFTVNTEYDFLFVIDLTSSTWALSLDGVEVATGLGFSDGAATVAGEFALVLNRYSRETVTDTAQIDDISVEHVPD
jgi:hypothetical protein